ncbi:hypothetical protein VTJ04DRAFT_1407 [Mycothermus thermophilus]|uniref:uncharacterized protein n=1 Tax=Humicola insolens TaxID=85995 RepID=UPI003743AC6B
MDWEGWARLRCRGWGWDVSGQVAGCPCVANRGLDGKWREGGSALVCAIDWKDLGEPCPTAHCACLRLAQSARWKNTSDK